MNKPIILLGSAGSGKTRYAEAIMARYDRPYRITWDLFWALAPSGWAEHDCLVIDEAQLNTAEYIRSLMAPYSTDLVFVMQDMEIESDTYTIVNL